MFFASDNSGPAAPQVLEALSRANTGYAMGYGSDPLTAEVSSAIRTLFEAPEASVYLVPTGTSANALILATLSQPWQTIFCTPRAHIHEDECNAPEFYSGGAKLTLVGEGDVMTPEALRLALESEETRGVHGPQRGPVALTNVTERGNLYSPEALSALSAVAKPFGLPMVLDGARFANACVALDCTPADMSWKAGMDAVVFGGTKNGLMGAEAVVIFDPAHALEFEYRRKRAGLLFSKHRYLAAQMQAYLQDDLWRDLAGKANARCAELAAGLEARGLTIANAERANLIFFEAPRGLHKALHEAGAQYHLWGSDEGPADEPVLARLVCDWSLEAEAVQAFLALIDRLR